MMNPKLSEKYLIFIIKIIIYTSLPRCHCRDVKGSFGVINESTANTTSHIYTFAEPNSFLRLETNETWNILKPREVIFEFRTDRPHGLLMYHTVYYPNDGFNIYELYVLLENGKLKIIHEFGSEQQMLYIGQGLNHDQFHTVKVNVNPMNGSLSAYLDYNNNNNKIHKNNGMKIVLKKLAKYFENITQSYIPSVLYFGGIDSKKPITHHQYSVPRFIGCIGKIKFIDITENEMTKSHAHKYVSIQEFGGLANGCVNLCKKIDLCANNALCINHYTYKSCDCFGTKHEDWHCRSSNISVLALRGYSFVSYKIYNYKDKVHSDLNRIGFHFKTETSDGILLYATGEQPQHNYVAINLHNGILHFEMDLGDGAITASIEDIILNDNKWHNITIKHHSRNINIFIDNKNVKFLELPGPHHHLHVDPDIFFGGLPTLRFKSHIEKLKIPFDMNKKFIGCLKFVYFNKINILYDLNRGNKAAHYHSIFPPEYGCSKLDPTSITMSTKKSHFIVNIEPTSVLKLSLEFKAEKSEAILASGSLKDNNNYEKYWFLHLNHNIAEFTISSSNSSLNSLWTISSNLKHLLNFWQHIAIDLDGNGMVSIVSNYRFKNQDLIKGVSLKYFNGNVSFGSSFSTNSSTIEGLRGCLRDISINQIQIDPRVIYHKYTVIGKISLDNCQLVDPCNSPNACEHGGKCVTSLETGNTKCDCDKTGYVGKTCHFSLFKRKCEELYLAGYHKTGTYIIDIDRNGPLPPAHVICSMSDDGMIQTIVEHNIRHQVVVRERGKEGNYYLNVTYRDFTPEMLHSLIMHSKQCSQYIKYECNSAPLRLSSYTWMQSTEPGHKVTSINSDISGRCKCSTAQNCVDRTKYCNCDSETTGWKHDDGVFTNPKDVGITRMFFLQTENLTRDSEAHLILGNVSCIDSNTREYEITFKTKESYLEVSGWEGGDMAVSFRTTASKAVIFYQAPLHSHHGYFKAVLSDENEITFEFSVNDSPRSVKLISSRRLNTGDWQQIWVDSDSHHMRFTVNLNSELIDLEDDDEFSSFEGPLYVGGAPKNLLSNSDVRTGFIGCLRGLVLNDKVVNLNKHVHRKEANIETGCRPSCRPDLCKNGGTCVELWGGYECKCANPIAHSGKQCENDINANSMTFITPSSYFPKLAEGKETNPILEKDIIISFRTHMSNALIFYANDYCNNFVQLHIENGTHVVFTFNTLNRVVRGAVKVGDILTSGNPIQIKVDRSQRSKSILTANDVSIIIDHPIKFLTKYSQKPWKIGDEFELVKPARPPVPIEAHNQLFLGGVDEVGATSQIQGIVGCLQGFVIGGKLFDLEAAANEPSIVAIGQIKPGCKMLCDQMPCSNGGACTEDWKNSGYICNCSMTSYEGETCNKDVGARFDGYSLVRYTIEGNKGVALDQISVHLAFSTDKKPSDSGRTILLVTYAYTSCYVHIALMSDGGILVEEDDGKSKLTSKVMIDEEFSDANRHWLLYTRKGESAQLIVDSEIYDISSHPKSPNNENNEQSLVLVGAANNGDIRFENFSNFVGCISNVLVELNGVKIEPLESAFGGRSDLDQVKVEGDIKQGLCAQFKIHVPIITSSVIESPEIEDELWLTPPEPKLTSFEKSQLLSRSGKEINKTPIFIICLTFLLIVLLSVGLYMWNLQKTYKIRQFQGDTPFFHPKRNSSTRSREVKFHMIPNVKDDSEAAVKLLQHQEIPINSIHESHPLKESKKYEDIYNNSKFKEEKNEQSLSDTLLDDNKDDHSSQSRVRFADST